MVMRDTEPRGHETGRALELRRAFLADIIAHPDDDAPRLILADWLDERDAPGDRDRAEFIRVQCELGRWPCECDSEERVYHPECRCGEKAILQRRQLELLPRVATPLIGPWPGWILMPRCGFTLPGGVQVEAAFRRGFVEAATLPLAAYLEHAPALHAATPLREVTLTGDRRAPLWPGTSGWIALLRQDLVGRLDTLDLAPVPMVGRAWREALRHAHRPWRGLRRLVLPQRTDPRDNVTLALTRWTLSGVEVVVTPPPG
jgi:uncharacterized protein (TIGR02996 family)